MKKFFAAAVIIGLSAVYVYSRMSTEDAVETAVTTTSPTTTTSDVNVTPAPSTGTTPAPTQTPAQAPTTAPKNPTPAVTTTPAATPAKTGYKDGMYTGKVVDASYGLVQVKATIKSGLITNIAFLQYPNHGGHTQEISQQVMPLLTQEAIKIQSANVSTISGATQTVDGFNESLADALAQAKA
jgi:uncharacterized protein with FMN-binding domain